MRYEHTVETDATPERIWSVLLDVERWPEWTASMRSVRRLGDGPFAVGCRVRIRQLRLPAVTWRVTELADGRAFTWEARSPGAHTVATYRIDARPGGGSAVTLGVRSVGFRVVDVALDVRARPRSRPDGGRGPEGPERATGGDLAAPPRLVRHQARQGRPGLPVRRCGSTMDSFPLT